VSKPTPSWLRPGSTLAKLNAAGKTTDALVAKAESISHQVSGHTVWRQCAKCDTTGVCDDGTDAWFCDCPRGQAEARAAQ
jgi:hypothetical protein